MNRQVTLTAFNRLLDIMDTLREECPWDKKQTLQSLRHLTIEETYELGDAILDNDLQEVKNELGDLFLHLVFYAKIGAEQNAFTLEDVLNGICEKLVHRHPHIYGDVKVENEEDVKRNWEQLKLKEGRTSVLEGVPKSLPALVKAYRMQEKVKGVGFEFENQQQVEDKFFEELQEFKTETDKDKREVEFGDMLFSLINWGRFEGINPEDALERTNKKFQKRFQNLETLAKANNESVSNLSIEELDKLWEIAKQQD